MKSGCLTEADVDIYSPALTFDVTCRVPVKSEENEPCETMTNAWTHNVNLC